LRRIFGKPTQTRTRASSEKDMEHWLSFSQYHQQPKIDLWQSSAKPVTRRQRRSRRRNPLRYPLLPLIQPSSYALNAGAPMVLRKAMKGPTRARSFTDAQTSRNAGNRSDSMSGELRNVVDNLSVLPIREMLKIRRKMAFKHPSRNPHVFFKIRRLKPRMRPKRGNFSWIRHRTRAPERKRERRKRSKTAPDSAKRKLGAYFGPRGRCSNPVTRPIPPIKPPEKAVYMLFI
jgi:hypothetical protein